MCACDKSGCCHPEKLQGSPQECTPEQIQECHGDAQGHPCETQAAEAGQK